MPRMSALTRFTFLGLCFMPIRMALPSMEERSAGLSLPSEGEVRRSNDDVGAAGELNAAVIL